MLKALDSLEVIRAAAHVAVYLRRRLPNELFCILKKIRTERGRGSVEVVVEDIGDVGRLRALHGAEIALYSGIALPQRTTLLIDRRYAFSLDESAADLKLRSLANGEDVYFALLWHRFGTAASLLGEVTECNPSKELFCLRVEGKRDQWCRLKDPTAQRPPNLGD